MTAEAGDRARRLWHVLAPPRWPLPPERLPEGTALVGGAVRDGLLGRLPERPDLDLVVEGDALALARALAKELGGAFVALDGERSIARLVLRGWTIDLARCAGEDLAADLRRRDYTVNAIALPLRPAGGAGGLVDPCGGLTDLAARRLVAVDEANLLEDPLRLLRGPRLAAELGFAIDPTTWGWIVRHRDALATVAGERVLAEVERLAAAPGGEQGLATVLDAGLLAPWTGCDGPGDPWFRHHRGALLSCLTPAAARIRGLTEEEAQPALPLARLALVLDSEALTRLPASRRLRLRCARLRRWLRRLGERHPPPPTLAGLEEPERLALQRELEEDLPGLLLLLPEEEARSALARWRDRGDPLFHPRPPLDGRTLQERLGLRPGPLLGDLLAHLTQENAFGRLGGGRAGAEGDEASLEAARRWLEAREPDGRHD